jgi:hypothetical protein
MTMQLTQKAGKRIVLSMDAFSQQRVLELRQEIASLQRDNDLYRSNWYHTASDTKSNHLRRLRLVAIQDELLRLDLRRKRIQ